MERQAFLPEKGVKRSRKAYRSEREDNEGTTTGSFDDNGHKLWVDGTEIRVPAVLADANVVVAVLALQRLPKDVSKFTVTDDATSRHDLDDGEEDNLDFMYSIS